MAGTIASARYAFAYVGNPRTNAEKMKALSAAGTLLIAEDHVLAEMLPGALDRQAGRVAVALTDIHAGIMMGLLFEPDVSRGGMHLALELPPARASEFLL